jgi:uncharacterized protein YacL
MKLSKFRALFVSATTIIGVIIFYLYFKDRGWWMVLAGGGLGLLLGIGTLYLEDIFKRLAPVKLIGGAIGLALGLFLARLISNFFEIFTQGVWQVFLYTMSALGLGYLGAVIGGKTLAELPILDFLEKLSERLLAKVSFGSKPPKSAKPKRNAKVIDTSAIIDGRIVEVAKTGWLDGLIFVPRFVVEEIQTLSDSTDPAKRAKGKRALELLQELKEVLKGDFRIIDQDYKNLPTDEKLIKLCAELQAKLVTTDYNLNQVCKLYDVEVLNVNELFLALRTPVKPGDQLTIQIVKEGKERDQGVGYLDDGTMVVVEQGRKFIGKELEVVVAHLLHTPSGRIVFAQPKN